MWGSLGTTDLHYAPHQVTNIEIFNLKKNLIFCVQDEQMC